jgi:hypothetical protein
MKIEAKSNCPLDGFKPCRELECAWFMKITGHNPNTGDSIDDWGCAVVWNPILMIENSQMQRQTGAAVESFRNEMVKSNEVGQRVLLAAAGVPPQAQQMILESKK